RTRRTAYLLAATTARRPLPRTPRSPANYFKPAQPARTRTLSAALMPRPVINSYMCIHPALRPCEHNGLITGQDADRRSAPGVLATDVVIPVRHGRRRKKAGQGRAKLTP